MFINHKTNSKIYLILLGLYFALVPMENIREITGGTINKYIAIAICIISFYEFIISKKTKIRINYIHLYITFFVIFWSLSIGYTPNNVDSNGLFARLVLLYISFMLITTREYSERDIKQINNFIVFGAFIFSLLGILYNIHSIDRTYFYVFKNKTVDPNFFCSTLILPIVVIYNNLLKNNKKKIMYILMLIVIYFAALVSGSRGGLISIIISTALCIAYILSDTKQITASKKLAILFGITLIVVALIFMSSFLPDFIQDRLNFSSIAKDKGSNRLIIWKNAFEVYKSSSLFRVFFGYGYNSFRYIAGFGNVAHNGFVQTIIEGGIIGITILICLLYHIIRYGIKYKNIYMIALGFACIAMGMTIEIVTSRYFWNIIMYILILGKTLKETKA